MLVIGIDPGPTTGIVAWRLDIDGAPPWVIQCNRFAARMVLEALLEGVDYPWTVQIERFVVARGSMRAGAHGETTRRLIQGLEQSARFYVRGTSVNQVFLRSASEVKPWATDQRLLKAGLLTHCRGMPHARDAARHALYAAVKEMGIPDPLSKEWNRS